MAYKTHGCIRHTPTLAEQIKKKKQQRTNNKGDEINITNIINDNTFNLHDSFWIMTRGILKLLKSLS